VIGGRERMMVGSALVGSRSQPGDGASRARRRQPPGPRPPPPLSSSHPARRVGPRGAVRWVGVVGLGCWVGGVGCQGPARVGCGWRRNRRAWAGESGSMRRALLVDDDVMVEPAERDEVAPGHVSRRGSRGPDGGVGAGTGIGSRRSHSGVRPGTAPDDVSHPGIVRDDGEVEIVRGRCEVDADGARTQDLTRVLGPTLGPATTVAPASTVGDGGEAGVDEDLDGRLVAADSRLTAIRTPPPPARPPAPGMRWCPGRWGGSRRRCGRPCRRSVRPPLSVVPTVSR
jgi:hypothetical protein